MSRETLQGWIADHKVDLAKYKQLLEIRLQDIKDINIHTINRESDLIEKGKARQLAELIEEL